MTQDVFAHIGQKAFGDVGRVIGQGIGASVDQAIINRLSPARAGARRLSSLTLMNTAKGAGISVVFGRARVGAQLIWAADFKEHRTKQKANKSSPASIGYYYSLSFALGLCEGEISSIGKVWADGQEISLKNINYRLYLGTETQMPDPLIVAIEGDSPAYRALAYVVFEDFDLSPFGGRLPNMSVEVFRKVASEGEDLDKMVKSLCLIPGAGEFVYDTQSVLEKRGLSRGQSINHHLSFDETDFEISLAQAIKSFPNLEEIKLVIAAFGSDLRAGQCHIVPGVETKTRRTYGEEWSALGANRQSAHLISRLFGTERAAYGGTPSDASIRRAISAIKGHGLRVTIIPFIMMDISEDNALIDPYGGLKQPPYPWRGRITASIAPSLSGSPDGTLLARQEIAQFVGTSEASHFAISPTGVSYNGPPDYRFSRFILHYAALAKSAGGVDRFILGSELRGLTRLRGENNSYPFVESLRQLALQARTLLGAQCQISYGADWSEYGAYQPQAGRIDFPLDALWADDNIDFIGLDWYAPLTDWRDGDSHLDALAGFDGQYDQAYLQARIRSGEDFDWYYASDADRDAQIRTPITDGAYNEPFIYRAKDLIGWWSQPHHPRNNGLRQTHPTAWVPQSKPIIFIELGCGAVDKGANTPNRFLDPKSVESSLPYYSNAKRDDAAQSAYLRAFHQAMMTASFNPSSAVYGGPMIEIMSLWCWDARPFPAFPALSDVWGDADNWQTGHWLNGRVGGAELYATVNEILKRTGLSQDQLKIDLAPQESRDITSLILNGRDPIDEALRTILPFYGLSLYDTSRGLRIVSDEALGERVLFARDLILGEGGVRRDVRHEPALARLWVEAYDIHDHYQILSLEKRHPLAVSTLFDGRVGTVSLPLGLSAHDVRDYADRVIFQSHASNDRLILSKDGFDLLRYEPGDTVFMGDDWNDAGLMARGRFIIDAIEFDETPKLILRPHTSSPSASLVAPVSQNKPYGADLVTAVAFLDLAAQYNETDEPSGPIFMARSAMGTKGIDLYVGQDTETLGFHSRLDAQSTIGEGVSWPKSTLANIFHAQDRLIVRLEGEKPETISKSAFHQGENCLYVAHQNGLYEAIWFQTVTLLSVNDGVETLELSGLLRGASGTERALLSPIDEAKPVWLFSNEQKRVLIGNSHIGSVLRYRAGPQDFGGLSGPHLDVTYVYQAFGQLPRGVVHARLRRASSGDLHIGFKRTGRLQADGWDVEPSFGEDENLYECAFFEGQTFLRQEIIAKTDFIYTIAQQNSDYPLGFGAHSRLEIRQKSKTGRFGPTVQLSLVKAGIWG